MQWVTRDGGSPQVWWGTASGQLTQQAHGSHTTYQRAGMHLHHMMARECL